MKSNMTALDGLQNLSEGIKRGDSKLRQGGLLWLMFQTIVGAHQKETRIMFLTLPNNNPQAISEWIDQLEEA